MEATDRSIRTGSSAGVVAHTLEGYGHATTHCGHGRLLNVSPPCSGCFPAGSGHSVLAFQGLTTKGGEIYAKKPRTFTREEVLTVLKAELASLPTGGGEEVCVRHLMAIFARME